VTDLVSPVTREHGRLRPPAKFFAPTGKMFCIQVKTIGHSFKNLGPSQKNLHHPWCPKLVVGLGFVSAIKQNVSIYYWWWW